MENHVPLLQSKFTFDNRFVNNLPADQEPEKFTRQVHNAAYSFVMPTKVAAPKVIAIDEALAGELGFEDKDLSDPLFSDVVAGNAILDGMAPYAMNYGGHQFGNWAGQLGDGRAINLGELVTPKGEHRILQLKGAGITPYSRSGDGLAVLRSSVREFLCSQAMEHLGIATTKALSLSLTGEDVMRDIMYNGNAALEPGAVVCRVSSSFTRFGHFQLPAFRQDIELLKALADHTIAADFPHLLEKGLSSQDEAIGKETYLRWFEEVCQRTCKMVVGWQRVGFVHGVMNTDNMSIVGETIDYGPYGWIDDFDVNFTPNTTDRQHKRYRFGTQGEIAQWNLFQLANAIYPLVEEAHPLEALLNQFADDYQLGWREMMAQKLGLESYQDAEDLALFESLEALLSMVETDMSIFYRQLSQVDLSQVLSDSATWLDTLKEAYYQQEELSETYLSQMAAWLEKWQQRVIQDNRSDELRVSQMNSVNPKYVLRNYLSQQAIDAAQQGDYSEIHHLQKLLRHPYDEQPEFECYAKKRPDWARDKVGCSMLSCSS
ncbi:MAG: protein adenylyltransferase SelO [Psychrobium sp.]